MCIQIYLYVMKKGDRYTIRFKFQLLLATLRFFSSMYLYNKTILKLCATYWFIRPVVNSHRITSAVYCKRLFNMMFNFYMYYTQRIWEHNLNQNSIQTKSEKKY